MRTVFVVDDDLLMRETLTRLLQRNEYRVRSFPSPSHALPLIDLGYPDAIVTDHQMPGMTGVGFARCLKERNLAIPMLMVTGSSSLEFEEEARCAGVVQVFKKPLKDTRGLVFSLERAIADHDETSRNAGLDHLRMSFLTGLAHELRTPLTAIKLALDNLFTTHASDVPAPQEKLVAIGQRNIDRIIQLVEGQLDLLQITLGDVSVSRRCVDLRDALERAVGDTPPGVRRLVEIDGERIFMFTDPDRLGAAVRYVLERGSFNRNEPVRVRFATDDDGYGVEIEFENTSIAGILGPDTTAGLTCGTGNAPAAAPDECFETRAFHRIVASLSGEFQLESGRTGERIRLRFPLRPRYEHREDFLLPVNGLREAAMLSGKTISLVECVVDSGGQDDPVFSPAERDLFERSRSVLSDGDVLVRGRAEQSYCLALVDRCADDLDRIADFLSNCSHVEIITGTPAPESIEGRRAATDLEPVA